MDGGIHTITKTNNEDRAREFQVFKNDFLTLQTEKNEILKSLASHIMQKKRK